MKVSLPPIHRASVAPMAATPLPYHPQPHPFQQTFNTTPCLPHQLSPNLQIFHNSTHCCNDGSKQGNRIGFAYSIGDKIFSQTSKRRIHLHSRSTRHFLLLRNHTHTTIPAPHPYLSHYLRLSGFTYCHFWSLLFTHTHITHPYILLHTLLATYVTIVSNGCQATWVSLAIKKLTKKQKK